MTSETGNQLVRIPQSSESSTTQGDISAYPAKSLNLASKRPVKDNKVNDVDQLMGYLD
jgi:hypothetical protein